jgi:hypothetical protein
MLEPRFLQYSRIHIVFKMAVVKRETNAIETKAGEELGVSFHEEVF